MTLAVRRPNSSDVQFGRKLSSVPVEYGLSSVEELWEEIEGYIDIILGRTPPPVESPYLSLAEVATMYYCRAMEIDARIHQGERVGDIAKGSAYYRFRTGELRSFIELSKKAADLGSRRLTQEQLLHQQRLE